MPVGIRAPRRARNHTRRAVTSALFALVAAVVIGLLPGPLATSATAADPAPGVCSIGASGAEACPPVYGPPGLWSPQYLTSVSPRVASAMKDLEAQAIGQVITDHGLTAADRDAVLSYARDDAEANLWALIVQALRKAPTDRSPDQQAIVDWFSDQLTDQRQPGPASAAVEYAKFAGKDVQAFRRMLGDGASEEQIKDFLTGTPEPYDTADTGNATGGYCVYHPPAPYQDEYDGHTLQSCFTPCQNAFGCAPPTPSYDQFVKWGSAHVGQYGADVNSWIEQAKISSATVFGALGAELGGAGAGALLTDVLAGSAVAEELFPFAGGAVEVAASSTEAQLLEQALNTAVDAATQAAVDAGDAAFADVVAEANSAAAEAFEIALTGLEGTASEFVQLLAVNAASIGFGVGVAVAAIAIAVQVGINVANLDQMPAKLAAAIAQSRQRVDAGDYFGSDGGPSTLFAMFTSALTKARADRTCDNGAVDDIWQHWADGKPVIVPEWMFGDINITPCLNPRPVPAPAASDPHWVVSDVTTGAQTESPSITFEQGGKAALTETARVRGDNWFVLRGALDPDHESESLRIWYTDWQGRNNLAWLMHTQTGWRFYGVRADAEGKMLPDPNDCGDQCWTSDKLHYVGPDGHLRTASIADYAPPTGQPFYSTSPPAMGSPITFDAGGFQPGNTVGAVSYQWQFQTQCGDFPCTQLVDTTPNGPFPTYVNASVWGPPVAGANVTHTWGVGRTFQAQLTATDEAGHQAVTQINVPVAWVPPRVILAKDCAVTVAPVGCNNYPTEAGSQSILFGGVELASAQETAQVKVDWGDGSGALAQVGQDALNTAGVPMTFSPDPGGNPLIHDLRATHTYAKAGLYTVTVTAWDPGHAASNASVVLSVKGPQEISFDQPTDPEYGQPFTPGASGTNSGFPVTFSAGPAEVCTVDPQGTTVKAVGVGSCTVTAHQAGGGPIWEDAPPVSRTVTVRPAPLTIIAENKTKTYGDPNPAFTARFSGLRNGDTAADIDGLLVQGPAADSGAGTYPIVASGASNPNYDITYLPGQLRIDRALLTITPDDQTRVYGSASPSYTAQFDGLVNGDQPSDITGLKLIGAPQAAHVGTYDIHADFAKNPNYDYHYGSGTETVRPAPLTVTADDKTHPYGSTTAYSASYDGLVNGEQGVPGLKYAGAPAKAAVGTYPIVVSGSTDPDYHVTYVDGTESITPARLTIRADDKTRVYGAPSPAYTTTFSGLQNGDLKSSVAGLTVTGAPANAGVGSYPIVPSGGVNPNYDIHYVNGTESVTKAPLTITAKDATKVYGAADPAFPAKYDGLVNGDTPVMVGTPVLSAAPTGSHVGSYPIVPSGVSNPNYDITFANGTETITPAPLTIRAQDATAKFGTVATYTWKGIGWVNGDSDTTIDAAPTCIATVQGAAASKTTAPGSYVGAITCSGAADSDYTIGYAPGKLTVDPVVRLDEAGLPTTVPHQATLDGRTVQLPTGDVEVGFGTSHGWSFPGVVVDSKGVTYLTSTGAFQGPVAANVTVTASYTTMTAYVDQALTSKGLDSSQVTPLKTKWATVQGYLAAGNKTGAITALHDFATLVRSQSGKKISTSVASQLLFYAQTVYVSVGGTGTV